VSATRVIQEAIYSVLSADSTLAGLSLTIDATTGTYTTVGVYDDVPDGASFPHVLFGNTDERRFNVFGGLTVGLGYEDRIRIHARSRYQGKRECLRMMERIRVLIAESPLAVSGFSSVMVEFEDMKTLRFDLDKIETRDAIGEFCITVQP